VRFARFMQSHDRGDEAVAHLEAEAKNGSDPAMALEAICEIKIRRSDAKGAREAVDRLMKDYPDHPRTWLARGRLALAQQRYDEAAEALRHYVASEQSYEGQRMLALAEAGRRSFPAAIAAVDAALQFGNAPTAELLHIKATILDNAGDSQQVIATMRRLQQQGTLPPADRLLLARALYQTGRQPAGRDVLVALLAEPSPPTAAYLEYAFREGRRDPAKSREYLERVLAEVPRQPDALRLLVSLDLAADKSDDALARIEKAAQAGRLSPQILLLKAQVLAQRKDYKGAEEEARRAFAASPNLTPALDLLASIYTAENRLPEAIASFEEADKAGALPPTGQILLARLQLASGHRDAALALYERVLAARNDLPGAKNDLAFLLAEDGQQLDRALTLAQEAQQAEPENPEIVDTLGFVYQKKGLNQPAADQFKYAIELSERANAPRADYHYHLGLALHALGKDADAAAAFEAALKLDASFPHAEEARRELEAAKTSAAAQSG
jgi:tetratricopeptide (TPR) repeat protein